MTAIIQQQYNRLAAIYDGRWQSYIRNSLAFLVDWAQIAPEEQILDVACGTGELAWLLTQHHPEQRIIGVDFSIEMLAIAQRKCETCPQVKFQPAFADQLPWEHPHFDTILCASAFHYFEAPQHVLSEMQRVLKPDGRVIILDWCRDFLACELLHWFLLWLDPAHQRCYTEAELHQLLIQSGYQIARSRRFRFGLIWGLMIVEARSAL